MKLHKNTLESTRHILGESELARELQQMQDRRLLMPKLAAIRAAKGLSQSDIARKMGCTQGKVSKLEHSDDDNVSLGDLKSYLGAMELSPRVIIAPTSWAATAQVKFYASRIRECFTKLVKLSERDPKIHRGISNFHVEALGNFMALIAESAQNLPKLPIDTPVVVDAEHDSSGDDEAAESQTLDATSEVS